MRNIKKQSTKRAFHMFCVELEPKNNNKDIYEIGSLLDCKIRTTIPNVRFLSALTAKGMDTHKSFCFRRARCVKCAGDHPTINYPCRKKSKDIKCILCENNNPANYKGCMDLRRNFFSILRRKVVTSDPQT